MKFCIPLQGKGPKELKHLVKVKGIWAIYWKMTILNACLYLHGYYKNEDYNITSQFYYFTLIIWFYNVLGFYSFICVTSLSSKKRFANNS